MSRSVQNILNTVLALLIAVISAYGVATHKFEKVEVRGLQRIDPDTFAAVLRPWLDSSVVAFETEEAVQALQQKFAVRALRVEVAWPNTLRVHVVERSPRMWWLNEHGIYALDDQGFRLNRVSGENFDETPVLVRGCDWNDALTSPCLQDIARIYRGLENSGLVMDRVSTIVAQEHTHKSFELLLKGQIRVRLGSLQDLDQKLEILAHAMNTVEKRGHVVRRFDVVNPARPVVQFDRNV